MIHKDERKEKSIMRLSEKNCSTSMRKMLFAAIAFIIAIAVLFGAGSGKVFAGGGVDVVEMEAPILHTNSGTGMPEYVELKFSPHITGSYVLRTDVSTGEEVKIGELTSDYIGYYKDNLSDTNGPKPGATYKYRLSNPAQTLFSGYSSEISIPNPLPEKKPDEIQVSSTDKKFKINIRNNVGLYKTCSLVVEYSKDGTTWAPLKEYAAGTYDSKLEIEYKVDEEPSVKSKYYFRAYYKNAYGAGPITDPVSWETQIVNIDMMTIDKVTKTEKFLEVDLDIAEDITKMSTAKTFVVYLNGQLFKECKGDGSSHAYVTVPVHYGVEDEIKVQAYGEYDGKRYYSDKSFTIKAKSRPLSKPVINGVAKIDNNTAGISWQKTDGAQFYEIYNGKKLVKTVKGTATYAKIKKKGAGKGKYKVVAGIKETIGSKTTKYTVSSKTSKPKTNEKKFSDASVGNWAKKCYFKVTSVKLSGNTYTVTGYAVNKRYFTCNKWNSLSINIKSGGKVVAKKTVKNYALNLKGRATKKITFKIKGKKGADLYNLGGYSTSAYPVWNE